MLHDWIISWKTSVIGGLYGIFWGLGGGEIDGIIRWVKGGNEGQEGIIRLLLGRKCCKGVLIKYFVAALLSTIWN